MRTLVSILLTRRLRGVRPPRRRPDPASPLPRHPRGPRRLHLRGRPVVGLHRGRDRRAAHVASRTRTLRPLLPGRQRNRLHRAIRRRRTGLCDAGGRRRPETVDLLPRHRAAADPLGRGQPGVRLVAGRPADPLPFAPRRKRGGGRQAPRSPAGRRASHRASDAPLRRRRLVSGRRATGLFAALPGLPRLEALRRRLGAGPLHLRPRHARGDAGHRRPALRPRPDVDRQPDLLHLGPLGNQQPLLLGHRERRHPDLDGVRNVGRPLAGERRRGPDRLRAGGHPAPARHERRRGAGAHRDHRSHRRPPQPPVARVGGREHRALRHLPDREAPRDRGPRRGLLGAGGEGGHAHRGGVSGRSREVARLVAGRDEDRLHLRRHRRGRDLRGLPVRRRGGATDRARPGDALQPELVTRRQPDRLLRQGRPALRGDGGRQGDRRGRGREARPGERLRLVAPERPSRHEPERPGRVLVHLHLVGGRRGVAPGDRALLQRVLAGVGRPGELPVLPQRPDVPAPDRRLRVELRARPGERHLRGGAPSRRPPPLPAGERRGARPAGGRT